MRPFPRGPGGKQTARAPGLEGCWQGEGLLGWCCQALAGLEGGWASRAPGNRSRSDPRGVLWSVLRAWLRLLHLEAGGRGTAGGGGAGGEGSAGTCRGGGRGGCCDRPPAGHWPPLAAGVPQEVRAGLALSCSLRGRQGGEEVQGCLAVMSQDGGACFPQQGARVQKCLQPTHAFICSFGRPTATHCACPPGRLLAQPAGSDPDRRCPVRCSCFL